MLHERQGNQVAKLRVPSDADLNASVADYTYLMLREGIEIGRFPPGRRMREVELANWLGVSRTPVRQALTRLEVEGMLVVAPRQGLVVASLDRDGVVELYDTRLALEVAAAGLAARRALPLEITALEAMLEAERCLPDDARTMTRHNRDFHRMIVSAAHNRYLEKALQPLLDAEELLRPRKLEFEGRAIEALGEHERIVAAIAARDADRAEMAARAHVLNAFKVRMSVFSAPKPGQSGGAPLSDAAEPSTVSHAEPER